jgi:hypothetical protein
MGRIITLNGQQETLSHAVNRVVKEQRGKSRPFILVMVEEDGMVTVASNMTNHNEASVLLSEMGAKLRGN